MNGLFLKGFLEELEKTSINIKGLRKAWNKIVKPNLSRAIPKGEGAFYHKKYDKIFMRGQHRLNQKLKKPLDKEISNRVVGMHEAAERSMKGKSTGYWGGHAGPEVIMKEHNILKSLPSKHKNVVKEWNTARKSDPLTGLLSKQIPNYEHGKSIKLNRSARKHFANKIKEIAKKVNEEKKALSKQYPMELIMKDKKASKEYQRKVMELLKKHKVA